MFYQLNYYGKCTPYKLPLTAQQSSQLLPACCPLPTDYRNHGVVYLHGQVFHIFCLRYSSKMLRVEIHLSHRPPTSRQLNLSGGRKSAASIHALDWAQKSFVSFITVFKLAFYHSSQIFSLAPNSMPLPEQFA